MVDVAFLTRVRIFANLNGKQLQSRPDKLQPRRYQRGEVIFHEDDPADRMHIIVDGRERDIALFQSGDCFGEMALLDGSNRSATATAVDATETMVLFRQGFLDFLGENPELDADVNQMLGDMVFLDIPTRVAKQLLALAETYSEDAKPGDQIVVPLGQDELARLVGPAGKR